MKFPQEEKETIYNKYVGFIDKLSDDLEFKTEISPKEIVYAVLGLVEDQSKRSEDLEDTVKYWFHAFGEKQKEAAQLLHIVDLAECYIGDESGTADAIDFWNALYEYKGEE